MNYLILAEGLDPTEIGKQLGQAQDIQQVMGIIVTVLLAVVLALVVWYLRERKAWHLQEIKNIEEANSRHVDLLKSWGEAKDRWRDERAGHTVEKEKLMREMFDFALRTEKVLEKIVEKKGT